MNNINLYDNMLCNKRTCGNFKLFFKRRIWLTIIVVIWILGKYMQPKKISRLLKSLSAVCFLRKSELVFYTLSKSKGL